VKTINQMRDLRAQLDGWEKRTKERDSASEIAESAKSLREKVLEIEKPLQVPDLRPGWADNLNQGVRLLDKLSALAAGPALGDYRPTDAAEEAFADLTARIETEISRFNALVADELPGFNALVAKGKLGAVVAS
jgi:hypothetical protein